jgi:hypothetical protein
MGRWRGALACWLLGATLLSTGCGGGGGGGESDGGDASVSVNAQPASFNVDAVEGAFSEIETVLLTLNSAPGPVYPRVTLNGAVNSVASLSVTVLNDREAQATISSFSLAPAGTYSGTALLEICGDSLCGNVLKQYTYPVTVTVHRIDLAPSDAVSVVVGATGHSDLAFVLPFPGTVVFDLLPNFVTVDTSVAGRLRLNYSAGFNSPGDYGGLVKLRILSSKRAVLLERDLQVLMHVVPA